MEPYIPQGGQQPEAKLQKMFIIFLLERGWWVKATHGSVEQSGVPDLFATHPEHGYRWIDIKVRGRYRITAAQYQDWPKFCRYGSGVWITSLPKSLIGSRNKALCREEMEAEYKKLWEPFNWYTYIPTTKDPERKLLKIEMGRIVNFYHDRKRLNG